MVSHVHDEVPYPKTDEADSFIPLPIRKNKQSEEAFDNFLKEVFTGSTYSGVREKIKKRYPSPGRKSYKDQVARAAAVITDSSFTCNTRFIIDSYLSANTKVYAMDYQIFSSKDAATHASDLLPLFNNPKVSYGPLLKCVGKLYSWEEWAAVKVVQEYTAPSFQRLFLDHAIWGNPNQNLGLNYKWHTAYKKECAAKSNDTCVWNVMKPQASILAVDVFKDNKGADKQTASDICEFWSGIAQEISKLSKQDLDGEAGYTPGQVLITPELK